MPDEAWERIRDLVGNDRVDRVVDRDDSEHAAFVVEYGYRE
jgi:hypothetical protein